MRGRPEQRYLLKILLMLILPSGLGGEGGGTIGMPIDVTYGGTRTVGTASISGGTVKFTPGTVEV